ncbi:MAG: 30S ribosomal protein S20, partial [Sandaracinaceae bacterium]|nr:30S ribosomal protein S20 [Sandaracinaceae bacterium]
MANVESAKKRIRQTARRTERNKHVRSTVRGSMK